LSKRGARASSKLSRDCSIDSSEFIADAAGDASYSGPGPLNSAMSLDISRRIRVALDSDSPTKNLSDLLTAIDVFIQQQQDAPDPAVFEQLQDEGEAIYKELVDHSSSANIEAFITIMHAFLPIFEPLHIITSWWDLVLRAALRDPRLSAKALQQVKAVTLRGLIHDSSKAPEFRKRIIELYLLDVHDETSRRDALEHATMSADERRIQKLWKHNLGDILEEFYAQKPDVGHLGDLASI
jgi:hypothetical protein